MVKIEIVADGKTKWDDMEWLPVKAFTLTHFSFYFGKDVNHFGIVLFDGGEKKNSERKKFIGYPFDSFVYWMFLMWAINNRKN